MKKTSLLLALAAAAVLAACGGKPTENVQTQAAAPGESTAANAAQNVEVYVEETKAAIIVDLPEEFEPEIFEGTVTGYNANVITVSNGSEVKYFDISRNEDDPENPIVRDCYVEVSYADVSEDDVHPSDIVSVILDNEQLAIEENRDPVLYGKLQFIDNNELSIIDDAGRIINFDPAIVRKVAFGELTNGSPVAVTYVGSIYDDGSEDSDGIFSGTPIALKIVSADAYKSEDAALNYIDGVVENIGGGKLFLTTDIENLECSAPDAVLEGFQEEDKVRAYYTGSLSDIVVAVEKLEKR